MDEEVKRALFYGLCGTDGEAQYDTGLYINIRQTDGKTYVLLQNESEGLRHVQLSVEGKFAVQHLGTGATLEDGILSCAVPAGALSFFTVSDTAEPGLYCGNIRYTALRAGTFSLCGVTLAALYTEMSDGTAELIRMWTGGSIVLTALSPKSYLKLFFWDSPLSPSRESRTLWRAV